MDDEEQTATIIDKATGVVVDIWIDEDGHIQSDGNIVDDIENLVKPTVTYELDPPAGTYGDEVKITITATEEKNGIVRMVLPDNSEIIYNKEKEVTKEYIVTENRTYTFVVEGANGRKTTKYVEVKNITSAANIVMEVQNTEPTNQPVNVLITYDENVKMGGQVLVNADRFQYSIGENNWQNASSANTTIQVGVNGTVYARYYNGTEGFGTTSVTIQNIDKIGPNTFDLSTTKTTNSITVSGSTEDTGTTGCAIANVGVRGYQYKLSSSTGEIITNWTTETTATSYTFNDLTQGTTYKVPVTMTTNGTYYVWVKDQAGNTANKPVTVNRVDTTAPTTATIASSNVDVETFTLTATGADGESGVAKYEFYIRKNSNNNSRKCNI